MLKMRLQRIGRRNDASFRVIVTDSRRGPKSGKHIDLLGSYNPKLNQISIDGDKAKEWIGKGVQVSDTVHNLLVSQKIIEGKKRNVLPKKSPIVSEVEEKEETPAAPAGESAEGEATADAPAESADEAPAEEPAAEETPSEEAPKEEEQPAEEPAAEATEEEKKD